MKSLYNKNKPNAFSRSSKFAYGCDLYVYIRRYIELNYTMVVYSFKKKSESFALYTYISSNARTRISI